MKEAKTMNETGSAVAARKRAQAKAKAPPAPPPQLPENLFSAPEVRSILTALTGLKQGDGSVRLPVEWTGMQGKIAETFNEVVELNARMAEELARLRRRSARKES